MKTILITGVGGLTPRSIATIIKKNHPDYKLVGCDVEKKTMGFFWNGEYVRWGTLECVECLRNTQEHLEVVA